MRTLVAAVCLSLACGKPTQVVPLPLTQHQQPALTGCDGHSVVALSHSALTRFLPDGTSSVVFKLGDGLSEDNVIVDDWQQKNGFLATYAFLEDADQSIRYEYLVLDASGNTVFHRIQTEPYNPTLYLGSDGSLAVAGGTGWVVKNGTVTSLEGLMPLGPVLANNTLAVARGMPWDAASPKGILDLGTMTFTALNPALDESSQLFIVNEQLTYVSGTQLVIGGQTVSLPATPDAWYLHSVSSERFILLRAGDAFVVVNAQSLNVSPVIGLPDVMERYGAWDLSLTDDGTALAGFGENGLLQLKSSTDFGATWTPVGNPMVRGEDLGLGQWLRALGHGDSVFVMSMSTGYGHYLNSVQLISGGTQTDVADPGLYVNNHLDPGAADLSRDGQCAAVWVQSGDQFTLNFLDAKHGVRSAATLDTLAWMKF